MTISDDKLIEMFSQIDKKLDVIHIQTTKTNGRVTNLEYQVEKSIGKWISDNPYKFLMFSLCYVVVTLSILFAESREAIMLIIKNLIGL